MRLTGRGVASSGCVFLLASFVVFPSLSAANVAPTARVDFDYAGPSALEGRFLGVCDGLGLAFSGVEPRRLTLDSEGGTLVERIIRVNETQALSDVYPVGLQPSAEIHSWDRTLPPGRIVLEWEATGLVVGLPFRQGRGPSAPFSAELTFGSANFSSVQAGVPTPADSYWLDGPNGAALHRSQFPGWARLVEWGGAAHVQGGLTFYLRHATIRAPDGEDRIGPYEEEASNVTTPLLTRRTLELRDAFLDVPVARLDLPAAARLLCGTLKGFHEGNLVAASAGGTAVRGNETRGFENRALSLQGAFHLEEAPHDAPLVSGSRGQMKASAEGDLNLVGFDFEPILAAGDASMGPAVGVGLLAALAAAFAAKNLGTVVGLFYSRFARDSILNNPNRNILYEAVCANPGLDLSGLARIASLHLTTVTYHVQALRRVGLVTTHRNGRSTHVLPRTANPSATLPGLLASRDAKYAFLVDRLGPGPLPLRDLAAGLCQAFSITLRAAYIAIDRAARSGTVERFESPEGVMVRCAVTPPSAS